MYEEGEGLVLIGQKTRWWEWRMIVEQQKGSGRDRNRDAFLIVGQEIEIDTTSTQIQPASP